MLPVVSVEGRLAADPELRFSASGTPVLSVRIVASSRKRNDKNEWVDDKTLWLDVTGFRQLALNAAESLAKGDLVLVQGKLQTDEWEDQEGNKRSKTVLIADSLGPSLVFKSAQVMDGVSNDSKKEEKKADETAPQGDEPPF